MSGNGGGNGREFNAEKAVFAPQVISQKAVQVVEDRHANKNAGIETGIGALDKDLIPMRPGELVVVLGYTSNYKSGLMNYIARHHARKIKDAGEADKRAVVTFTWEQSIEEQGIVDISQLQMIDVSRMMRGELNDDEWKRLKKGAVQRGGLPWWLVGHSSEGNERRPRLSMTEASLVLEYIASVQQIQPALIVLDYLQRIKREGGGEMREQFMAIVDRAKDAALAFHCPVILGSQAKRDVKSRQWRLPGCDDGQETSNLEQSADKFLSVWMPKNDYPAGSELKYGNTTYTVDDNLLVLGIMKQKFGKAPVIMPLHVKPEVNEIYERS